MNVGIGRLVALSMLLVALNVSAWADEDKPPPALTASQLQRILRQKVTQPVIDDSVPLRDARDLISQRYGIEILIDTQAFNEELMINGVESQPIKLPKMFNVSLRSILQQIAKQVAGTAIQEGGIVWIAPPQRARQRLLRQPVDLELENVRLHAALHDVAEQTGFTIVLDSTRTGDSAQSKITTTLRGVGLEDAVRTLADMTGLKAILVGDIFYVTTPDHASELAEEDRQRQREQRELEAEKERKEQEKAKTVR